MKLLISIISALLCIKSFALQLPKQATKSYDCTSCTNLSHETLEKQWMLTSKALEQKRQSNAQKSYSYKQLVSSSELKNGIQLPIDAKAAVISIKSIQNKALPQLQLSNPKNKALSLKEASLSYQKDKQTKAQVLVHLSPNLGNGPLHLKSINPISPSKDSYLISVYERASPVYMQIQTDALHYQYGQSLTATISLNGGPYGIEDIRAFVIDAQENKSPLSLTKLNETTFQGSYTLESETNVSGRNWHIEAEIVGASNHHFIKRSGHCAFSYAIPSASLIEINKSALKPLSYITTIEVATASRYALQSVLYRKDDQDNMIALKTIQKSQWLEPGTHQIELSFEGLDALKEDKLYLGYLRLIDYGQLKTVYQFDEPFLVDD